MKLDTKKNIVNTFDFDINKLSFEELQELQKIKKDNEYSSSEVDKILFLRDLFAKNGVIIEDLDVFLNILNGLKLGKNLI